MSHRLCTGFENVNLFPILPYVVKDPYRAAIIAIRGSPTVVPLRDDLIPVPSYQSRGWTISGNSEGKYYAHTKAQAGITVVTEARVTEPGVPDQLNVWLHIICDMISEEQIPIPESSDLFLEIHQDLGACNYYFADHTRRTVFWLHTFDTIGVGRPHTVSSGHLQHALQENYWIHVELFPETASQYSAVALNELQAVLLRDPSGEAGMSLSTHAPGSDGFYSYALTSETPAFPYTAKQREGLVDLLERSKDHNSSPQVTTYVARLWVTIRMLYAPTDYGTPDDLIRFCEEHSRLVSERSVLKVPDSKQNLVLATVSRMFLFGLPDVYLARFESLWVDRLVNTTRWRKHISATVEHLKQTMSWIVILLISNIAMICISAFSAFIKSSLLLCTLGLVMALALLREQQRLVGNNATAAAVHLNGFRYTAIAHSLPQALFAWALLLLAMQGLRMTLSSLRLPPILATLPLAAVLVIGFVGIRNAVYPRQKVFKDLVPPAPIPL
ncbi:hypothetical protein EDB83DRAFT_2355675 [Lactarius deliciosus]|nr:hypothetical protein EDB83DRAFT_2355675 [Lactarius deliciosus]